MRKFNPTRTKNLKIIDAVLKIFFRTKKERQAIVWSSVKSILVVDFTLIGDLIMLIPFLKILRENAPYAKLFLCCNPFGQDVLEEQGMVDGFYLVDGLHGLNTIGSMIKNIRVFREKIKEINQRSFDVIIEPRGDLRYIFFMHFLKGKRKISYNYTGGEEFLTDVVIPDSRVAHLVEDKLVLLRKIGCCFGDEAAIPKLCLSEEGKIYNDKFLEKHGIAKDKIIIGIHPGSSWESKRWKKYGALVRKIHMAYPSGIFLIFLAKGEEKCAEDVVCAAKEIGAEYLLVSENLRNYICIVADCSITICNDSSAAHIAAAYGHHVTVIYGPFSPECARPMGSNVKAISHPMECKPCLDPVCKKGMPECIEEIGVDEVWQEVEGQLAECQARHLL